MTDEEKTFDCVAMKNRIQAELLQEYEGMTSEEERQARQRKLSVSDSPAARMWRAARERHEETAGIV